MTPPSSKYGPLHALAAGAVLVYTVLANGFAAFWHQFLHGMDLKLTEANILPLLCTNTLLFGGLFLILWVSTLFGRARSPSGPHGRAGAPRPPQTAVLMEPPHGRVTRPAPAANPVFPCREVNPPV